MTNKKSWPLRTILTTQFLIVAIIPLLIASVLSIILLVPKINHSHHLSQLTLSESISAQVISYLENAASDLNVLANFSIQKYELFNEKYAFLDIYTNSQTYFSTIYLTNSSGLITNIGLPNNRQQLRQNYIALDISQNSFYKNVQSSSQAIWSNTFLSAVTGRLTIAYSKPLFSGAIIGEISIEEFPNLVNDLAVQHDVTVMILDQNRQLIAHPDVSLSHQQINLSNLELVQQADNGEDISLPFTFNNKEYIGTPSIIPGLNWMVITAQPRTEMEAEKSAIYDILFIAIITSIASAGFIAMLLAREFLSGFAQVALQAQAVATGRYETKPNISKIREVQRLTNNLSKMSTAIEAREHEVTKLNQELERRVEERTEDLKQSNRELELTLQDLQSTQDQLVQSEKLSALGSLVAGVSHELNTPIGNSQMTSSTLSSSVRDIAARVKSNNLTQTSFNNFIDEMEQGTLIIERNLYRASELIHSFKQVAVDQASSKKRQFDLHQHIHDVLTTLHPMIKKAQIHVDADIPENIKIESFPGAISQVITNLIQNSIIHGFEGSKDGKITIAARETDDKHVQISVEDNGKGIDTKIKNNIYDPFFTTKRGSGGSGLGLHIVHNLTTKVLKGTVHVESTLGEGTKIILHLPENI
jgi:signal transduction histidine kinase